MKNNTALYYYSTVCYSHIFYSAVSVLYSTVLVAFYSTWKGRRAILFWEDAAAMIGGEVSRFFAD